MSFVGMLWWLVICVLIACNTYGLQRNDVVPLNLQFFRFSTNNIDNYVTTRPFTQFSEHGSFASSYSFVRREGYILKSKQEGTIPVYTYYHSERKDHVLANNSFSEKGYEKMYLVGYIFINRHDNSRTPLYQYYNPMFHDYFAFATSLGRNDAETRKYKFSSILGYVLVAEPPSDYVTVTQDMNGVWWVAQQGNHFMTVGVNHVNNGGMDDGVGGRESAECQKQYLNCGDTLSYAPALGYSPYYNSTMARYGGEKEWASNTQQRLLQWNFNTISGWSATVMERQPGLLYCHLLDIGTTWLSHGSMGDVFSQEMHDQMYNIAAKQVAPRANDTNLIGWQLDNEFNLNQDFLSEYLLMNMTAAGRYRAIQFLENEYKTIEALNTAWNINCTSFDDVSNHLHDKGLNITRYNLDKDEFTFIFTTQYFNLSSSAIRHYDANHMILGIRLSSQNPQAIRAMIPYVDWVDQHMYSDLPDINALEEIHQATGKPVIVGEFSFTAVDSNLPNTRGARSNHAAATQNDRAVLFTKFVTELAKAKFVVGYHWWQWADEPATGRWPDGENSNCWLTL
jgi:agarase